MVKDKVLNLSVMQTGKTVKINEQFFFRWIFFYLVRHVFNLYFSGYRKKSQFFFLNSGFILQFVLLVFSGLFYLDSDLT